MRKKLLTFLLAVLTGTGTLFAESGTCGTNVNWSYDSETKTLTISGSGAMADYENVSDIPWKDFLVSIKTLDIRSGVTGIGNYAFNNCTGLTSVTIPSSVNSIGDMAFANCTGLTSVTIPDGVTSIGKGAFLACTGLTSVTIPNSVTSIGYAAFYGTGLSSVTIPNNVTSIGEFAFFNCVSLTSINVANDNPNYCSIDGVLFNKEQTILILYPAGKTDGSYTIPNSVTSIGDGAFANCTGLTSVEIPNSVTGIGTGAFASCSSLTSIEIPNSVTSIGNSAFNYCSGLVSVTNHATTPQTINANVFEYVNQSACTLNVPAASVAAYQEADVWKDFGTIQAIDDGPTSAPAVYTTPSNPAQKLINNGNVYILSGEKTYTVTGQEVK